MQPSHIEHIGIAVTSLDESIPFFEKLLGTKCYAIEEVADRGGMHHIAFAVENIEGHLEEAKELGIRLIDQAPRGGAEGLSIAFLHPKSTFGVLTELCENKNK